MDNHPPTPTLILNKETKITGTKELVIKQVVRNDYQQINGQMDNLMDNFMYKKRCPNSSILA